MNQKARSSFKFSLWSCNVLNLSFLVRKKISISDKVKCLIVIALVVLLNACEKKDNSYIYDLSADPNASNNCGNSGLDGEGCAKLVTTGPFVAGDATSFIVEFTVGGSGIAVGGGISIGIHHAADWSTQIEGKAKRNYVKVESNFPDDLVLERYDWLPNGMFSDIQQALFKNAIYHHAIVAKVTKRPIASGEKIVFVFGANSEGINVPHPATVDQEFRVTTDVDGNGIYDRINDQPGYNILPANPESLVAFVPAQAVKNEDFDILIRVEDRYLNLVDSYEGSVSLVDEVGDLVASEVKIEGGIGNAKIYLNSTGYHRIRLSSADDKFSGRSNPIRVFDEMPSVKLYWGDLHGHTGVSDGLGKNADEFFSFGRDQAALDVIALTDHGHPDWAANIKAVQDYYMPGKYVTILAQEAGAGPNHMNLYFRRDDTAHIAHWQNDYAKFLQTVYEQYNSDGQQKVITAPHHFAYDRGIQSDSRYPFGLEVWDDRVVRFVEVYSAHGTSEFKDNPRPLTPQSNDPHKYMQSALSSGLKFGVIGASDNHDSKPGRSVWGRYPGGLSGIWAKSLERDEVWDAIWNYSVYGTSKDRIYVEFFINNEPMGSSLESGDLVNIEAYIIGKTDDLVVEIVLDNQPVRRFETDNGMINFSIEDSILMGEHFYYLRVTQSNGERAWSTPIWVSVK